MPQKFDEFTREKAAQVIAESVMGGIQATCDKHGISRKTLERWKKRLESDKGLAEKVAAKQAVAEKDWADNLPGAISEAIGFLKRAAEAADVTDPDAIYSVAGALKILTDVTMSRRVLDARLSKVLSRAGESGPAGSTGEAPRPAPTADERLGLQ